MKATVILKCPGKEKKFDNTDQNTKKAELPYSSNDYFIEVVSLVYMTARILHDK